MNDQLAWRDGTPISTQFDDPYFSLDDGLAETTHTFLGGNDLPARFRPGFHIAELGFGTGLNFLTTWAAWEASGTQGTLHFTSFEAFPMTSPEQQEALTAFPTLADYAARWAAGDTGTIQLRVIQGDARQTLPTWDGQADAWFLDGFSPAKNPELWDDRLLAEVGHHTAPTGTFATYTAAGHVRRALTAAGFDVTRTPGFGRKRHMSQGTRR